MAKVTKKAVKKTAKKAKSTDIITEKLTKELDAILLGSSTKGHELGYCLFRVEHDPKKDEITRAGQLIREMNSAMILTMMKSLMDTLEEKGVPKHVIIMSVLGGIQLK